MTLNSSDSDIVNMVSSSDEDPMEESAYPRKPCKLETKLSLQSIHVNQRYKLANFPQAQQVIHWARSVLNSQPPRSMSQEEEDHYLKQQAISRWHNAHTFQGNFYLPLIQYMQLGALQNSGEFDIKASLIGSGILNNYEREFRSDCLPLVGERSAEWRRERGGWKTPKASIAYGFMPSKLDPTKQYYETLKHYSALYYVDPFVVDVFFIVQSIGAEDDAQMADLKAARGGAALVSASRQRDVFAGTIEDEGGQDKRSLCFSMTLSASVAMISVHWIHTAEEGGLEYHSHQLEGIFLGFEGGAQRLRQVVQNILDWGNVAKRAQVLETLKALKAKDEGKEAEKDAQDVGSGGQVGEDQAREDQVQSQ